MSQPNLQPTDYAVTLAAWRERNKGEWRGTVKEPTLAQMRSRIEIFLERAWYCNSYTFGLSESFTRALYAAIQAEGRR